MSKFFYDMRLENKQKHDSFNSQSKRAAKLGTKGFPLTLLVQTSERKEEVQSILKKNKLFANIAVNAEEDENIAELDGILNKPITKVFDRKPKRNDPCSCGSGKKYKKCCG